jgi:hypothetical protein
MWRISHSHVNRDNSSTQSVKYISCKCDNGQRFLRTSNVNGMRSFLVPAASKITLAVSNRKCGFQNDNNHLFILTPVPCILHYMYFNQQMHKANLSYRYLIRQLYLCYAPTCFDVSASTSSRHLTNPAATPTRSYLLHIKNYFTNKRLKNCVYYIYVFYVFYLSINFM